MFKISALTVGMNYPTQNEQRNNTVQGFTTSLNKILDEDKQVSTTWVENFVYTLWHTDPKEFSARHQLIVAWLNMYYEKGDADPILMHEVQHLLAYVKHKNTTKGN